MDSKRHSGKEVFTLQSPSDSLHLLGGCSCSLDTCLPPLGESSSCLNPFLLNVAVLCSSLDVIWNDQEHGAEHIDGCIFVQP